MWAIAFLLMLQHFSTGYCDCIIRTLCCKPEPKVAGLNPLMVLSADQVRDQKPHPHFLRRRRPLLLPLQWLNNQKPSRQRLT